MTRTGKTLRVAVAGWSDDTLSYVRSLSQLDEAEVVATTAPPHPFAAEMLRLAPGITMKHDPSALVRSVDFDALVISESVVEPLPLIREALLANRHVLSSPILSSSPGEVMEVSRVARKRARILMFAEERSFSPAWTFVKRMVSERNALWRPAYLRGVTAPGIRSGSPTDLAGVAAADLALLARLVGPPAQVSAVAARLPHGEIVAAFINLVWRDETIASIQMSLVEPQECRRWALATSSKTILIDECDLRAPLRIVSSRASAAAGLVNVNPPVPLTEWPMESIVTPPVIPTDPRLEECRRFLKCVSTGDTDSSNAYFFATVASIWDAVQQSIAKSGVPVEVSASPAEQRATARPKLRLIRGRGTGAISDGKRPVLTVVSG